MTDGVREPVIGIDLGTTNSAVATVVDGRPIIIPNRSGAHLTPSMVGFTADGKRKVGEAARALADELPDNVAWATKRFIGRRWSPELAAQARALVPYALVAGPQGDVRIKIAGRTLPVTQVAAMILGELKLDAEAHFGRPVSKAVVTVPANFDDGQRNATKEAAVIAGLDVMRIVNEPTAAAVAYGLASGFEGRALVFDLGGGTFDVSILEVEKGVFQVRATGGDMKLGGEDFDQRIVQWLLAQVPEQHREVVAKDKLSLQRLKTAAENAKKALTDHQEVVISIPDLGDHSATSMPLVQLETALTRAFFQTLCEPLSRRCLKVCEQVMADARLDRAAIDVVLLSGGMTRVPLVRGLVRDFFGREPVSGINPDEVVALGAAVHAHELAEQAGQALLIDVAAHSLGVGIAGGKVRHLIARNTPVPAVAKQLFYPGHHGQTEARIPVYQGESDNAQEDARLGELVLHDLPVAQRGEVPIEVTFELSSEGTLSVRAVDVTTGLAEGIRIEARPILAPAEVDRLRREQSEVEKPARAALQEKASAELERALERARKLARLLERSAQENPSDEAAAAVGRIHALIASGEAALKNNDLSAMAEVRRVVESLTR